MPTKPKVFARVFFGIFYWPAAIIWAISYGILGGALYKILASVEDFVQMARADIKLWRKFPKRAREGYQARKLSEFWGKHGVNMLWFAYTYSDIRKKVESEFPEAPFPFATIIGSAILSVCFLPFRVIAGMIEGPAYLLERSIRFWQIKMLHHDPYEKFKQMLEHEREIVAGHAERPPLSVFK